METLLSKIGEACKPVQKGYPIVNGVKQNYYMFKRPKVSGIYWIGYEYDGAWSTTIAGALAFLSGDGWEVVNITKHDQV